MTVEFPLNYDLSDGTHVMVKDAGDGSYDFHLTRLNSEKHNFSWDSNANQIEESYETRFDNLQWEAIGVLRNRLSINTP
jgi:hypothetical protein